jgi:diguanylate cyclase (GGDEF)-like protein/PAS domain S-box-containing protein
MFYRGRFIAIFFILAFRTFWFFYYKGLYGHQITLVELTMSVLLLIPAWFVGKKFDEVSFLRRKLELRKEELLHEVRVSDERYKTIVEQSPNFIIVLNLNGEITYVNKKAIKILEGTDSSNLIGRSAFEFIDKSYHQLGREMIERAEQNEILETAEYKIKSLQGTSFYIESVSLRISDKGKPALMVVGSDITNRKKVEEKMQLHETSFRNLVETAPIGIIIHKNFEVIWANSAALKLGGIENLNDLLGTSILDVIDKSFYENIKNRLEVINQGNPVKPFEYRMLNKNGEERYVELNGLKTTFKGEEVILTFAVDITQQKKQLKKINHMAYYDALTGLPNRNLLDQKLEETLNKSNCKGAVLFLDLDRFKMINDTLGHSSGDKLLAQVAKRFSTIESLKPAFISRYGGDEFIIVIEDTSDVEKIKKIAEDLIYNLPQPFYCDNGEMYISVSIGISLFPYDGSDVETLIKTADVAMYSAKDAGRNTYRLYNKKLHEMHYISMELERDLRKALDEDQLTLHYQPKYKLSNEQVVATEALLRWIHPKKGIISPLEFIPLAEDTGLIIPIGNWVLKEACKQTRKWVVEGWTEVKTAVNVSVLQFQQDDFITVLKSILTETNLSPHHLELEITESVLRKKGSLKILNDIKEIGITIAIDDFGTGYSSLSELKYLPIDAIKIDKSFVDDINTKDESIVKTIIQLGQNLKFDLVAEGIETKDQLEFLRSVNCHYGQGYYYSKPVPPELLFELVHIK